MTHLKVEQTGRVWKIELDGHDLSYAIKGLRIETEAMTRRAEVTLDLGIEEIEISALGERDETFFVRVDRGAEDALQAIGWIKTGDRTTYVRPRAEEDLT